MARKKQRLTITIDAEFVAAGNRAVRAGDAGSLSGWINEALVEREERERRRRALTEAVAEYEARYGVITDEEIEAQRRADEKAAIRVRGRRSPVRKLGKRSKAA